MAGVDALRRLTPTPPRSSARHLAYQAVLGTDAEEVDIPERDADVPLSDTGRAQAAALGRWLEALSEDERPTTVITSPYVRAHDTARIALAETSFAVPRIRVD